MKKRAVFILSDMRSGSTLLDQLLGAHPDVQSLGELHWLRAYIRQDRHEYDPAHDLVCSCGQQVMECPFWNNVARRIPRPLETLKLRVAIPPIARRILNRWPNLFRIRAIQTLLGYSVLAADSLTLLDAAFEVSGATLAVDSSKSTHRYRAVHDADPGRSLAIILVRDFRAVAYSKMKRGHSLEDAAFSWRRKMEEIEALTNDLPDDRVCTLSYESLCLQPARELTRICSFLGIAFVGNMLERPKSDIHHIGGSPSKFDKSRARIALDESYLAVLTPAQLQRMTSIVGGIARRWGY